MSREAIRLLAAILLCLTLVWGFRAWKNQSRVETMPGPVPHQAAPPLVIPSDDPPELKDDR